MLHIYFYLIESNFYDCLLFLCLFFVFFFAISWLIFGVFSSSLLLQGVGDDFLFLQALVCFWDPSSSMASLDALIFFFFL